MSSIQRSSGLSRERGSIGKKTKPHISLNFNHGVVGSSPAGLKLPMPPQPCHVAALQASKSERPLSPFKPAALTGAIMAALLGAAIVRVMKNPSLSKCHRGGGGTTTAPIQPRLNFMLYPVHAIIRNSVGSMTRKLSVTSSQYVVQFRGTSSRRKLSIAVLNSLNVA